LAPRLLLDTHILVHWLAEPARLSRQQMQVMDDCVPRSEQLAVSDISLLEIAMLAIERRLRIKASPEELFRQIDTHPSFQVLPITTAIASQAAAFRSLRDPSDRVIVATARVHRLTLVTSDQRIIESHLVATIE